MVQKDEENSAFLVMRMAEWMQAGEELMVDIKRFNEDTLRRVSIERLE